MSAEIKKFYPKDAAKNPDSVLEQAIGEYESLLVIGYSKNGKMDVRATTNLTYENLVWLVENFKMKLLLGEYEDEEKQ